MDYPIESVREQFPMLNETVNGKALIYLDSAATALKPKRVIDAMSFHDLHRTSNVHRGVHHFSDLATTAFENARRKVESFIGCDHDEVVFTRGTTESINMVSQGLSHTFKETDEIILTELEHHSNIVPWHMLSKKTGAKIKWIPVSEQGELDLDSYEKLLTKNTRIVAFSGMSNTLGTKPASQKIIQMAKSVGALTLVDAAQLVTNQKINVKELGCDFLCFSGHKLFGPTGVGVLYGSKQKLNEMRPTYGGGAMIATVTFAETTYLDAPFRFEAGTPNITGVIGLGESIDFVHSIGFDNINAHEATLLSEANRILKGIKGLRIIGDSGNKGPILSFVIDGLHHQDIGSVLDQQGVAVRTGHHCTQPLLSKYGLTGTVRASFSIYNSVKEAHLFGESLEKAKKVLG